MAILMVKKVSSIHAGSGNTIMDRMATTSRGAAAPLSWERLRLSQSAAAGGRKFIG